MNQIPNIEEWEKEFDEKYPPVTIGYDGNETDYFRREWTKELIEKTLHHQLQKAREEALTEYKQFVLNVLDGVDIADGQCNTKAIRFALQSRIIHSELDQEVNK